MYTITKMETALGSCAEIAETPHQASFQQLDQLRIEHENHFSSFLLYVHHVTPECNDSNHIQRRNLRFSTIQRRNSRFFTISSLHAIHLQYVRSRPLLTTCDPSPIRTLKTPGCNRVLITCNTLSAYHVLYVVLRATWYEGTAQLLSMTELKSHLFELYFTGWTINQWLKQQSSTVLLNRTAVGGKWKRGNVLP